MQPIQNVIDSEKLLVRAVSRKAAQKGPNIRDAASVGTRDSMLSHQLQFAPCPRTDRYSDLTGEGTRKGIREDPAAAFLPAHARQIPGSLSILFVLLIGRQRPSRTTGAPCTAIPSFDPPISHREKRVECVL